MSFLSGSVRERINEDKSKYLFLSLVCLLTAVFSLLYIDRFAPDTMGWQRLNAMMMENGQVPYRDFYNYIPPGSIFRTIWTYALVGGSFLGYRLISLLERVVLFALMFIILRRYFNEKYVWIACVTSAILYASTSFDQFGDYNQTSKLYVLVAAYFGILFFENREKRIKSHIFIVISGIFLGLVLIYKHSTGGVAVAAFAVFLAVFCIVDKNKNWWKFFLEALSGFLLPVFVCCGVLYFNGALNPMLEQIMGSGSAKGSTGQIMFRFWNNIFGDEFIFIGVSLSLLIVCFSLLQLKWKNEFKRNLLIVGTAGVTFAFIHFVLVSYSTYWGSILTSASSTNLIYIFEITLFATVILLLLGNKMKIHDLNESSLSPYLACSLAAVIFFAYYLVFRYNPNKIIEFFNNSHFEESKADLPVYASYLVITALILAITYFFLKKKSNKLYGFILFLLAGFVTAFEAGMATGTKGLTYAAFCIIGPIAICILFDIITPCKLIKNTLILAFCLFLISGIAVQKIAEPYDWWGWKSQPITDEANFKIDADDLFGFQLSHREKTVYDEVSKLINENSNENDYILSFPHINLFNIITDRAYIPTLTSVFFFDVCPDAVALDSLVTIKKHPPKIIVWYNGSEDFWTYNENAFRNGKPSGQREILNWYNDVKDTQYIEIGKIYNLSIYRINDGTPINYKYFEKTDYIPPTYEEISYNNLTFSVREIITNTLNKVWNVLGMTVKPMYILAIIICLAGFIVNRCWWKGIMAALMIIGLSIRIDHIFFFALIIPLILYFYDKYAIKKSISIIDKVYLVNMIIAIIPALIRMFGFVDIWRTARYVSAGAMMVGTVIIIIESVLLIINRIKNSKGKDKFAKHLKA